MTTLKLDALSTLPRESCASLKTVCISKSPLVGCVQTISFSAVTVRPQVFPPLEENCSIADPSGLNRTTPEPIAPKCLAPFPLVTSREALYPCVAYIQPSNPQRGLLITAWVSPMPNPV